MTAALTVIVITRNAPRATQRCLRSLIHCHSALAARDRAVEFILADDCSSEASNPAEHFPLFRRDTSSRVTAFRFRAHQHFAAAMAYTMSLARGDVLFVSHDMLLTPPCVAELLDLAESQPTFGVIRPRSAKMDFAHNMEAHPPAPIDAQEDADAFAQEIRRQFRGQLPGWPALIGDALLMRRSVIERIGVFDPRFYGFWSDLDYGVRVQ